MSLILCPECGHQVSNSAQLCPQCGFNISNYLHKKEIEKTEFEKQKDIEKENLEKLKKDYYEHQYKIIYDTIDLPLHIPTDIEINKTKKRIKLSILIGSILLIGNIICYSIIHSNINILIFAVCALIFLNVMFDYFIGLQDAKKTYENDLNAYNEIINNPELYKKEETEKILKNDQTILKINERINEISRSRYPDRDDIKYVSAKAVQNIPRCPTCGSTNIEKISVGKKMEGGFFFGIFSSDVRNQFKCKNCGYKW